MLFNIILYIYIYIFDVVNYVFTYFLIRIIGYINSIQRENAVLFHVKTNIAWIFYPFILNCTVFCTDTIKIC